MKKTAAIILIIVIMIGITVPVASANDPVEQFVIRLYVNILGRDPDVAGFRDWTNQLKSGSNTGSGVAYGFFFSPEMRGKNLPNGEYVEILYLTLLNRKSDAAGKADWVKQLNEGARRENIFAGFVNSPEFDRLCKQYGIIRGFYAPPALTPPPPPLSELEQMAAEFFRLTNIERVKHGLKPLSDSNKPLEAAAKKRAEEATVLWSHTRPDGRRAHTAYADLGGSFSYFGENLCSVNTAQRAITGLMDSPGHRANILNPGFTHLGVGVAKNSSGKVFWAQLFVS